METLRGRCDSFVVETDVEYPTDSGMLFDALRKVITLTSTLCKQYGVKGWRQSNYNLQRLKKRWRKAQQSHRSRKADADKHKANAYAAYLREAKCYVDKSLVSVDQLNSISKQLSPEAWSVLQKNLEKIGVFKDYAELLMDQVQRRILQGEIIPTDEKIYSIFQPHSEWISKGKAGVPVELGLKVCILEDQYQFILHHQVMEKTQDVDVAVSMIKATQKQFPSLSVCSFDKGFHSPANQNDLANYLEEVILPKKGKLSAADKNKEHAPYFRKARRQHSAVESAINALEHNGLDRCRDHGIDGFKRYVALGILSRNVKRIGFIILEKQRTELKQKRHSGRLAQAA